MRKLMLILILAGIVLVSGCIGGGMGETSEKTSSTSTSSQSIETSRTTSSETGALTPTSSACGEFLKEDDFSSLDKNFWYVGEWVTNAEAYDKVRIENGVLIIQVDETDRGPYLLSQSIPVKKGR